MKYTRKSFSSSASSEAYRDNFDRIFRACESEFEFRGHTYRCEHKRDHAGSHEAKLVDGDRPTDFIVWYGKDSFVYETLVVGK